MKSFRLAAWLAIAALVTAAFGDVNGYGHQDLVTIGTARGGLRLYTGDGTGRWRRSRETRLPEIGIGLHPGTLTYADIGIPRRVDCTVI